MKKRRVIAAALIAGGFVSPMAHATDGYFSHGYGMKAKGRGGAATAMADDTFGGANNPASMVWVGERVDFGVDLFSPQRSATRQGAAGGGGLYNGTADSGSTEFLIPEFGYNRMVNPSLSLGVTVYGNGGMNTDYNSQVTGAPFAACGAANANLLYGCGRLGVDLMQLIVAPTASYKVNENNSVGISPLLGYQRFKEDGLQAFAGISSSPGNLYNKGYDSSRGYGVRIGWQGKLSSTVTLGAAYASKMKMSNFDKYKGLFAEQGSFDIPENYSIGIAIKANPLTTVAVDAERINYSKVRSIANGVTNSMLAPPANPLGSAGGSGFHWADQTVLKLGVEHEYDAKWTVRGGFNYGRSPIGNGINDVTFNIIAPGVVEKHLTLGATYKTSTGGELTFAYMHAFKNSVTGPSAASLLPAGDMGTETLKMHQNSFGIAYGWKL